MKVSREKLVDIAGELDLGMKCFIHKHTRNKLLQALEEKKPFAHFNALIHQMPEMYKTNWFKFKEYRMIEWIGSRL